MKAHWGVELFLHWPQH